MSSPQPPSRSTIDAHAGLIQHVEQFGDGAFVPAAAELLAQVIVGVDNREAGPVDGRPPGDQGRGWD